MNFTQAYAFMKQGKKVKLPSWCGYWELKNDTINMYTKDNRVVNIKDMENVLYTLDNICSDEWEVADEINTKILGGESLINFSDALKYLKRGMKLKRKGWNAKGLCIEIQDPNSNSDMTRPYIFMNVPKGASNHFGEDNLELNKVPWLPSQTDLLAEDWCIVE